MEMVDDLRARRFAPKEVRRQQLIEATLEVIAEKGVSGTTLAEVARTASLSVGTVNLHFDSKENLLKSTLQYLSEELQSTWSAIHQNSTLSADSPIAAPGLW